MVRKLVVAMAATGALSSGVVNALGLGDIALKSALNQPLNAEIELIQIRDLNANEILPNLATREDFNRAGVERIFFLNNMKFATVVRPNGTAYIKVSSNKPVREPYLNFLVEVHWPSGRLLREYTVLLDPPTFAEQAPSAVQAPATVEPVAARPTPVTAPTTAETTPVTTAPASDTSFQGDSYRIQANDTLYEIAAKVKPSSQVTVQQTMLALQQDNPDAFINNNINLLKRGKVLRLPDEARVKNVSVRDAVTQIKQQNQAWKQGSTDLAAPQIDATPRTDAEPVVTETADDGKLTIVSAATSQPDETGADTGQPDGTADAQVSELKNELALAQENLDKSQREIEEQGARLEELEDQIGTLQRLLSLKDEQLSALQAQLAEAQEQAKQATDAVKPEVVVDTQPVQPTTTPEPKPQPEPEQGIIDQVLASPVMLGTVGGVIIALVGGLFLWSRRRAQEEEEFYEEFEEEGLGEDQTVVSGVSGGGAEEALEVAEEEPAEPVTPQTADPVGEADIYIAYGRFSEAEQLLRNAINDEPSRSDLRVKLLEVYAEMQDASAFSQELQELHELADQGAIQQAEALKVKFGDALTPPAPKIAAEESDEFADLEQGFGDETLTMEDLDESLSLDDLDLEGEITQQETSAEADELSLDDLESSLEAELDEEEFGLDLGSLEETVEEPAAADELDLELSLDEEAATTEESVESFDELSLDLESDETEDLEKALDLDLADLEEELPAEEEFNLDEELSLDMDMDEAAPAALDESMETSLEDLELDLAEEGLDLEQPEVPEEAKAPAVEQPAPVTPAETLTQAKDVELSEEEEAFILDSDAMEDNLADLDAATESLAAELAIDDLDMDDDLDVTAEAPVTRPVPAAEDHGAATAVAEPKVQAKPAVAKAAPASEEQDYEFLADADEAATKLDLARAYIDMGDQDGARDILDEVMTEGNDIQKKEAQTLLDSME
ncbi:FimV/HubP family polar landmark protein [Spartinivicinus ruber]|uniref:FimV/HubP family polar landmark protein n=1 Tax=Spartinivicinus ruber TaxID=2683272 RepID=UPI0013CF5454|nr:FimV/HubP family polar landmark protein [Spartinivicinus ruber]